jgi:hypothetical protein
MVVVDSGCLWKAGIAVGAEVVLFWAAAAREAPVWWTGGGAFRAIREERPAEDRVESGDDRARFEGCPGFARAWRKTVPGSRIRAQPRQSGDDRAQSGRADRFSPSARRSVQNRLWTTCLPPCGPKPSACRSEARLRGADAPLRRRQAGPPEGSEGGQRQGGSTACRPIGRIAIRPTSRW